MEPSAMQLTIANGKVSVDAWHETLVDDGRWVIVYRYRYRLICRPVSRSSEYFQRQRGPRNAVAAHRPAMPSTSPVKGSPEPVLNEVKLSIAARELAAMFADSDLVAMGLGGLFAARRKLLRFRVGAAAASFIDMISSGGGRRYVEAIKTSPRAPVKLIAERRDVPVSRVRAWVYKARDREILRGEHGQGSIGIPYVVNPQGPSRSKDRRRRVRKRE